jgi:signal transduction histidine kinase
MNAAVSLAPAIDDQFHDRDLQKANDIISQFITSCSHSMREPLKSIVGIVHLLRNNESTSSQPEILFDMITKSTDRMEHMLDEMEHFLENSKRKVQTKTVSSREALEDVLEQQREAAKSAGVRCTTSIEYDAPCYADRPRISMILCNLVQNSIHFRDESKDIPKINVEINSNTLNTILTVSDNGIGIEKEFHEQIFQLFFRASAKANGAGIGLYVVSQAVEKMKGTIRLQSSPGVGSTFTVTIPNNNNF